MSVWKYLATVRGMFRYCVELEKYYGGRLKFAFNFGFRCYKHEDLLMVLEININHTGKTIAVFVWKFFIFTVIVMFRNFDFYVENLT